MELERDLFNACNNLPKSFLLDYVNSVMGRYIAIIHAMGSTYAFKFRWCEFSVVGYLYVDAVCGKAFE
jgi:hypothetical protein